MKSIRLKVKTIILIVVIGILGFVFADDVYYQGIHLINVFKGDEVVEFSSLRSNSLKSEMKRLTLILDQHEYELLNLMVISNGMTSYSSRIRKQDAENIYETYRKHYSEVVDKEYYDYMLNVILTQWFSGETDQALNLLNEVPLDSFDQASLDHYYLIKTGIALTYYDLDTAEDYLNKISESYYDLVNYIKRYMKEVYAYEIDYNHDLKALTSDLYHSYFDELVFALRDPNDIRNYIKGQAITITGNISIEGQPVQGVMVYAKGYRGMSSFEGYSHQMAVTDSMGNYTLETYDELENIGVKIPWHLIHDKRLERTWDLEFSDKNSYDLNFTSGIKLETAFIENNQFHYEINDPDSSPSDYYLMIRHADPTYVNDQSYILLHEKSGTISLDRIHKDTRFLFGSISSEDYFTKEMFSEALYVTGDYYFSVNRVSDNNSYSTNGFFSDDLLTLIHYEGDDYNEGDLLLDSGKVDEAIEWYKVNLSRHNLKVLVALYTNGRKVSEGEFEQILSDTDPSEAAYYLNKLIEYDGVTGQRLWDLARLYRSLKLYEKEGESLDALIEIDDSVYYYIDKGINTINRGKYSEGIDILLEYGDLENEGDRYYEYLILGNQLDHLPDEIKNNLGKVNRDSYKAFYQSIQNGSYEEAYKFLKQQAESPLKSFYHLLFMDAFNEDYVDRPFTDSEDHFQRMYGFSEYFRDETNKIQDLTLREVLMFMKDSYNWFH